MSDPHVVFKNVRKGFDDHVVLRSIDLSVERGECLSVIGGSGCGKSVLLRCLLGLIEVDSGQIFLDGTDLVAARPAERNRLRSQIGVLFQNSALFDSMSVLENVTFGLVQNGVGTEEAEALGLEKLEQVSLSRDVASLYPESLSGGMRKRVGIARAIAMKPALLLFDEPTSGLDPIVSDVINNLILRCVRDLNSTAIVITHDMRSCRRLSDRVAMMYQGRIIWSGTKDEMDTSSNPYLRQFVSGRSEGPIKV